MPSLFDSKSSADQTTYTSGSQTQQGASSSVILNQGKNSTGNVNVTLTDFGAVGASLALASETVAANERAHAVNLAFADAETDDALAAMRAAQSEALSFSAGAFGSALNAASGSFASAMGAAQGAYGGSLQAIGGAYASAIGATNSATDRAIAAILATTQKGAEVQKSAYLESMASMQKQTDNARADLEKRSDDTMQKVMRVAALGVAAVAVFAWIA